MQAFLINADLSVFLIRFFIRLISVNQRSILFSFGSFNFQIAIPNLLCYKGIIRLILFFY